MPGIRYTLTEKKKLDLAGIYLLDAMVNEPRTFPRAPQGAEAFLGPILTNLFINTLIEIDFSTSAQEYRPTEKGREAIRTYQERYQEFLKVFDLFSMVDLGAGEFAFASYFSLSDADWQAFTADKRWEDLRLAVVDYKNRDERDRYLERIDPVDIVFMSFVKDGRYGFDFESGAWAVDRLLGSVWDHIESVLTTNLGWRDLDPNGNEGVARSIIEDVAKQGAALTVTLAQEEERRNREASAGEQASAAPASGGGETVTTETVVTEIVTYEPVTVYRPYGYWGIYADPWYVSPVWGRTYW